MSTTEIADLRYDKVIDLAQERFNKLAPKAVNFEAEKGYAVQLLSNNDYLMKVAMENKASLLQAVTNVAAIGLSLNPAKKQAYLIPRNVKQGGKWISKIFLEPSYVGLCDIATMSGSIKWVQANVVYANDEFTDNGPGEKPTHQYKAFAKREERGGFVGVYCVAKTSDGDYLTTIMPAEDVIDIRDRSEAWKSGQSGPWKTDFNEQAKKTVIRRAYKTWPKTESLERLALAVDISNQNEGFDPLRTAPPVGDGYTAEQKEYYDQLISKQDAIGMHLFLRSIDDSAATGLFNSFEKGTITKYKQMVRELDGKGRSQLEDCIIALNDAGSTDDTHGAAEILDGMPDDAIDHFVQNCTPEASALVRSITNTQEIDNEQ